MYSYVLYMYIVNCPKTDANIYACHSRFDAAFARFPQVPCRRSDSWRFVGYAVNVPTLPVPHNCPQRLAQG